MSQYPDPAQPNPQQPPAQPYPQQPPAQPYPQQPPAQPYPQQPPAQPYPQQSPPAQPYPQQSPPSRPYPADAPTQFNPQFNPPPWQGQQQGQQQTQQPPQRLPQAPAVPAAYGYGQHGQPVPAGLYQDQESGLMLPQGTVLANPGRRIGAYFLSIPLAFITLGIGYLIWGLIVWGNGQTPALQVLGMRCYRPEDNRVAGFWWMALRETVGLILDVFLLIITELVSFIFMLTRPDRRTLHDLVAGTVVLRDPDKVLAK